ncbi:MAG: hypothetical protein ALAOOOJD_00244 [bacterium]|nr:hypothetical protein [bacterium]
MIDHLQQTALQALMRQREYAQHHEAEMAHRRIGHQLLDIRLHHRNPGAVNNADNGQNGDERGEEHRGIGKQWQAETQKTVCSHFQEHAGQNHRTGGRRFDMRIRQPRVKRKHWNFNGEGKPERKKEPDLIILREEQIANLHEIEGQRAGDFAVVEINKENRHQHQQAADHGINEKLQCGVNTARPAPHADDEIHRNEHRFPEKVEEQQVETGKHAHHAGFQQQHRNQIALDAFFNIIPGGEKDQRH